MNLIDNSIKNFTELLASEAPAPGGGSTAALNGALGAALIVMVASLTAGRKRYAEHEPFMLDIIKQADDLRMFMLNISELDTEAYNSFTAAFSLPKETDEEKAVRNEAMQQALKKCTLVPFSLIEYSLMTLELAESMLGRFNTNAASDLGVAVLNIKAAAHGAWLNVLINLSDINDEIFSAKHQITGSQLVELITDLADEIYNEILQGLIPKI